MKLIYAFLNIQKCQVALSAPSSHATLQSVVIKYVLGLQMKLLCPNSMNK